MKWMKSISLWMNEWIEWMKWMKWIIKWKERNEWNE